MISRDILKKVKQIEIRTRSVVNSVLAGEYHSVFKGQGMEFDEVREYSDGDDIRFIDWNVTARTGHPFVKKHVEEREMTVMLMVDASSSGNFGTQKQLKGEIAVEMCALLAFSAIKNNDRVGLIIFTSKIEKFVPPKKGKKHVMRVIRELLYFKPEENRTDLNAAVEYLNRVVRRRSVVFLVSDFFSSEEYIRGLRVANRKHDMVAVTVTDPREVNMPDVGFIELEDAETGEEILIDTSDPAFRKQFAELGGKERAERDLCFKQLGMDSVEIFTDKDYIEPLVRFFKKRTKTMR